MYKLMYANPNIIVLTNVDITFAIQNLHFK